VSESAAAPAADRALRIDADDPLARKIDLLQRFLGEQFFHPSGIMYSQWYWRDDELRPWRRSDFEGQSFPHTPEGFTPEGHNNNENSSWTSGLFLLSQCLRYAATRDDEALAYAAKAFRSLDLIFRLTEARGERGFLCKPYDCSASLQTSPDQYIAAMLGLWEYRRIADHAAGDGGLVARARLHAALLHPRLEHSGGRLPLPEHGLSQRHRLPGQRRSRVS
jgi:hypothetical protein